jgi:GT2 family glycosyltransferase
MAYSLKIAVGIATAGRREILSEALQELSCQIRLPDTVFICPASDQDFDPARLATLPYPLQIIRGQRGSCPQRNAILDQVSEFDIIVFFDDDFFASREFLAEAEYCFAAHPEIVAATGRVIADGINGPGIAVDLARAALTSFKAEKLGRKYIDQYNAYGCNMAVRLAPVRALSLRFDENLPLYGWFEDVDFCRRLACLGRIVKNERMSGVHLGHKGGRSKGFPVGYSQIANPIYLWRKGTCRLDIALQQMARNIAANFGKVFKPEPWIDRAGRARGNLLALLDLVRGRLHPRRILDLR